MFCPVYALERQVADLYNSKWLQVIRRWTVHRGAVISVLDNYTVLSSEMNEESNSAEETAQTFQN